MNVVQVIRVGQRSSATVVRVESTPDNATIVPVTSGSGDRSGERWWQGEGPPPELIVGSRVGDWYWDTISGDVFELNEGA